MSVIMGIEDLKSEFWFMDEFFFQTLSWSSVEEAIEHMEELQTVVSK